MKRLISWLLALTLIFGLVPMSAMAATDVEIGEGDPDIDVGFEQLLQGYTEANPIQVIWTRGEAGYVSSVTVPAKTTLYYSFTENAQPTMVLTANDEVVTWVAGNVWMGVPSTFSLTNATEEEVTYSLALGFPVGSYENPEKITELDYYTVEQAQGNSQGYFYTYTATETGTITFYFTEVPGTEDEYDENGEIIVAAKKYTCDISVTNMRNSSQKTLLADGVDNFGLELTINVNAGDELLINVGAVKDLEGNFYPEATMTWYGAFAYPAGSELNPITIEWNWDEAYANATANVTVEANDTYFSGYAGMILTANGTEIAQENGVFVMDAGTYELKLATPVGAYNNPEVIENIDGYTDSNNLPSGEYYYIWTATEDGTVTLDVTDGATINVTNQNTYAQYNLAEADWANGVWNVQENLQIEVVEGDVLKIEVVGLMSFENYAVPAIDYTLTGAFEAAVTGPVYDATLKFNRYALSFQEYTCLQFVVRNKDVSAFTGIYAEITQVGPDGTSTVTMTPDAVGTYQFFNVEVLSWSMGESFTCTLYGMKDGVLCVGQSYTTSVKEQAELKIATADDKNKTALVDLLNYGSAVQVNFSRDIENLPNKDLAAKGYDVYGTTEAPAMVNTMTSSGTGSLTKSREALSLQAQIQFQIIFKIKDMSAYTACFVVDGVEHIVESKDFVAMGSYTAVPYAFAPYMLRDTFTVVIKDADGNEVSPVYSYSVESVAASKFAGNDSNQDKLFVAMMKFADSVEALL